MKLRLIVFDLDDTLLDTSKELLQIANTNEFLERIKKPLPMLEGAKSNLDYLVSRVPLVLLTQGNPSVQMQKIESLGINSYFKKVFFVDLKKNQTKLEFFKLILTDFALLPKQALSVGNRKTSDIRFAKQLGYQTCLLKYGEHVDEQPQGPDDIADFEIHSHKDLISICQI